jgi:DnaJ family protein C protein 9
LGKIFTILSDAGKKSLYDETGDISADEETRDWASHWRLLFKVITEEDVNDFFKTYKNSDEEKEDLKSIYVKHKGDMDSILEEMLSSSAVDDEERFKEIIKKLIDAGDVEKFRKFTHETKASKEQRRVKYEKEAKEAEELRKTLGFDEKCGKNDKSKPVATGKVTRSSSKKLKTSDDDE